MDKLVIKRFLQTIAVLHIIAGITLPYLTKTGLFTSYNQLLFNAFGIETPEAKEMGKFLIGIFGPTVASWGVLFLYTINSSFENPSPRSWWFIVLACLVWAPYDTWLSIQHGIHINIFLNLAAFSLILVPLLLVRKHFFGAR